MVPPDLPHISTRTQIEATSPRSANISHTGSPHRNGRCTTHPPPLEKTTGTFTMGGLSSGGISFVYVVRSAGRTVNLASAHPQYPRNLTHVWHPIFLDHVRQCADPGRDRAAWPRDGDRDRPGRDAGSQSRGGDADPRDGPHGGRGARDAPVRPYSHPLPLEPSPRQGDRGSRRGHDSRPRRPWTALAGPHAAAGRSSRRDGPSTRGEFEQQYLCVNGRDRGDTRYGRRHRPLPGHDVRRHPSRSLKD